MNTDMGRTVNIVVKDGWTIDGLRKAIATTLKRMTPIDGVIVDYSSWIGEFPGEIILDHCMLVHDLDISRKLMVKHGRCMEFYKVNT